MVSILHKQIYNHNINFQKNYNKLVHKKINKFRKNSEKISQKTYKVNIQNNK